MDSNSILSSLLFAVSAIFCTQKARQYRVDTLRTDCKYTGGCHCKAVTFECMAPKNLVVWDCNCSICEMKKNWHFIVPEANFTLLTGSEYLQEYRFNKKIARHLFCKVCGVQAFYRPRSNPDGYAVTLACIDKDLVKSYEIKNFDGNEWENFIDVSDIKKFSKVNSI